MDSITTADVVSIVAIAICLLLSFFFSGSETAPTSSPRARMADLEGNGYRRARLVNRLMAQRERLIGAVLLGNNLANIAASSLATGILFYWFGDVGIAYATVVMTVIIVVFSEVLPKTIAINHPDRVSLLVARPIAAFVALLGPVTLAMEAFVRWVLRLVGVRLGSIENVLSGHDELRGAVDV